jgi:adenylosuccinate synthase
MSVTVVVGTQWGDEGKGKCVDTFASDADAVIRYQGGNNAGHTLVVEDNKTVLHLIPSGALYENVDCYLARGVVVHPETLLDEIEALEEHGIDLSNRLRVSNRAPLVMPWHIELDEAREDGEGAIGTTKKGIGPCYEQFVARQSILAGDLLEPSEALQKIELFYEERLASLHAATSTEREFSSLAEAKKRFQRNYETTYSRLSPYITDVETDLRSRARANEDLVFEGAQGTFLDVGMGTYPFVTSSHPTSAGACIGSSVPPTALDEVVGVCKAYVTRVGQGPMRTELAEDSTTGKHLRDAGNEYGATTGRPRRCGWLDLKMLRNAVAINGCTQLVLTKLDVLSGLEQLKVATGHDGEETPTYETLPGWEADISDARQPSDLPANARKYLEFVNSHISDLNCEISHVSVGPNRREIFRW